MAGIDFRVKIDVRHTIAAFDQLSSKEVPAAIAMSMNKVAGAAKRAIVSEMEEVFDNPNNWTLGAFAVLPATRDHLEAKVITKDGTGEKHPNAYRYLNIQDTGGRRRMKRSEYLMRGISEGQYWVPGKDAPLDANGNIQSGEITRILSRLGQFEENGFKANMTANSAKRLAKKGMNARGQRSEYFVARERGNGRPSGIYKYVGPGQVAQILIFTPAAPNYKPRISFEKIVADVVARETDRMIGQAVRYTLKKRLE
ncbi:hypothetical protein HW511_00290 [Asaia siamensis]|uniref:HK97 gp10 family phage protein n=1 Tax=Asaia siamensis TaxID=110479 RepID=A0ABQ1M3T9_9PROT|nr:hypothetical protein [Asaia siamensis]GBR06385.1 hypothetical protein AA0323_1376 [Asaia siamensis NRIC 0323]GGC34234.1 hypothetical protein GCM10007207_19750 [Asaia siamensis]